MQGRNRSPVGMETNAV